MNILHAILIIFSAISFLIYGLSCLLSDKMKKEFFRFNLNETQRKIIGISQILAGIALFISFTIPVIGVIASAGLSIQMLLGFIVRLKIKDSLKLTLPSFIFFIFNGYLCFYFLKIYL